MIKKRFALFAAIAISLTFIGIGIYFEENLMVMQKAALICMQCIGIG